MSADDQRSGRIRRREEHNEDQQTAEAVDAQPSHPTVGAATAAAPSQTDSSATGDQPQSPSAGVQPLPEQFSQRKKPRRSARLACHLDRLAVVELQLVLQFLDTKSKLKAARCSRRLLRAASAPFSWSASAGAAVTVRSAADVQHICSSLLRFALIHLRCVGMGSLQCAAAVPHIFGLELLKAPQSSAAELPQLLQHPNMARLRTMRLDFSASYYSLTADTVRLVTRLPQLHTLAVTVPCEGEGATFLQPLADAPALTNLTLRWAEWATANAPLMSAISGCAGLRGLSLNCLKFSINHAGNMFNVSDTPSDVNERRAAISALVQLQTLTLQRVYGINVLLPHLHHAPALRLLSIRCKPSVHGVGTLFSPLPNRDVLGALLTASPQLGVRLLMPTSLGRWMALNQSTIAGIRAEFERQWRDLQLMAAQMDRVTIVDDDPASV